MREATADEIVFAEAWCKSRGKRPHTHNGMWYWSFCIPSADLPAVLCVRVDVTLPHDSESAAIAALGIAIAELKEAVAVPGPTCEISVSVQAPNVLE